MAMQHDAWVDLLLVRSPAVGGDVATQRPAGGHDVWTAWPRGERQPRDCRLTFTLGASMTALSRLRSRRACRAGPASFRRRRPGACRHRPRHHAGLTLIRIEGVAVPIHRTILSARLLAPLALRST